MTRPAVTPAPVVVRPAVDPASRLEGHAEPQRARRCVLHVEDHPVNVLLMEAVVGHRRDVDLVTAGTVAEALRLAARLRPALLLLDLGLPDGDGCTLLRALRALPSCRDVRAVAVSADADAHATLDGSGFDERWDKPLDLPRVRARLDALLDGLPDGVADGGARAQALPSDDGAFAASGPWPAGKRIRIPSPGEH